MGKFILKERSYVFAIGVVRFCRLLEKKYEYIISKQLIRSGTAIGAIVREAEFGESRADFSHKLSITLKEANETDYWLCLVRDSFENEIPGQTQLLLECKEIIAILVAIVKKQRDNIRSNR